MSEFANIDDLAKFLIVDETNLKTQKMYPERKTIFSKQIRSKLKLILEDFSAGKSLKQTFQSLKNIIEEFKLLFQFQIQKNKKRVDIYLKFYLQFMAPSSVVKLVECTKYSKDNFNGVGVVVKKRLKKNTLVDYICGYYQKISDEEEENLRSAGKDFSLIISSNKKTNLFLGTLAFVNHDCNPNCDFISSEKNFIKLKTVRDIEEGEELFVYYGDTYFGPSNEECECSTCCSNKKESLKTIQDNRIHNSLCDFQESFQESVDSLQTSCDESLGDTTNERNSNCYDKSLMIKLNPVTIKEINISSKVNNDETEKSEIPPIISNQNVPAHSLHICSPSNKPGQEDASGYVETSCEGSNSSNFDPFTDTLEINKYCVTHDDSSKSRDLSNNCYDGDKASNQIVSMTKLEDKARSSIAVHSLDVSSNSRNEAVDENRDTIVQVILPKICQVNLERLQIIQNDSSNNMIEEPSVNAIGEKEVSSETADPIGKILVTRSKMKILPLSKSRKKARVVSRFNSIASIIKENKKQKNSSPQSMKTNVTFPENTQKKIKNVNKTPSGKGKRKLYSIINEVSLSMENDSNTSNSDQQFVHKMSTKDYNIMMSTDGGFCPLCSKCQTQFARHLVNKHSHLKEIRDIISEPKKSCKRRNMINEYRLRGLKLFNEKYQQQIPVRHRTSSKDHEKSICAFCAHWFSLSKIKNHMKKCPENVKNPD